MDVMITINHLLYYIYSIICYIVPEIKNIDSLVGHSLTHSLSRRMDILHAHISSAVGMTGMTL